MSIDFARFPSTLLGINRSGQPLFHTSLKKGLQNQNFHAIIMVMLTKKKKEGLIKKHAVKEGDTGSPEVQVAILTKRIDELASHLKKNRKDKHSRRGLLQMVANRQKHLKYLKKKSQKRYKDIASKLGLK